MIIGNDRGAVIDNIKKAVEDGTLNVKVEVGDPQISDKESAAIVNEYLRSRKKYSFKSKAAVACMLADMLTEHFNRDTEIVEECEMDDIEGGAFITSNHFSPIENTVIRKYVTKKGRSLAIVSNVGNFAMKGIIGFLMNYADTIPIYGGMKYMCKEFPKLLSEKFAKDKYVLIYPEQEMWFNYRKVRPLKRGAYFYAAKLNVPVVSCFVEMVDLEENDTEEFKKVKYILHVLGVIYPDPKKTPRENSFIMRDKDFAMKKAAYEKAYGKEMNYKFEPSDIAGWITKDSDNVTEGKEN